MRMTYYDFFVTGSTKNCRKRKKILEFFVSKFDNLLSVLHSLYVPVIGHTMFKCLELLHTLRITAPIGRVHIFYKCY